MKRLRVAIRADSSLRIGAGHVMRCLTLAQELRHRGADVSFICRAHEGSLIDRIRILGFPVAELPVRAGVKPVQSVTGAPADYESWLGDSWQADAAQTRQVLAAACGDNSPSDHCAIVPQRQKFDWLIVDHYGIDARWEQAVGAWAERILVIDDLANRKHDCTLLLDQTLNRNASHYAAWVPPDCSVLAGSGYALLRPEFIAQRPAALARRRLSQIKRVLISLGGADPENIVLRVLQAISRLPDKQAFSFDVVLGAQCPHVKPVKDFIARSGLDARVLVAVTNMAELMTRADIAIGAPGASSWERCCLGLPTLLVVIADNQLHNAAELEQVGAAQILARQSADIGTRQFTDALTSRMQDLDWLVQASENAFSICDGQGTERVLAQLML